VTATLADEGLMSNQKLQKGSRSSVMRSEATISILVPGWFDGVDRKLMSFVNLEPNWNSYGARPVHESVARAASDLLRQLVRRTAPEPSVVPTSGGGVQFEWHTRNHDLEIELPSPGRLLAVFEDRASGEEWEREFSSDLGPLVTAISKITQSP
jgi:hypothetical protein